MKCTASLNKLSDEQLKEFRTKLRSRKCTEEERRLLIEDMAYHHCSWVEIATAMGTTRQYLEEKYRDVLNQAQAHFKHDLRRMQFSCAGGQKGNSAMLIWLGKQYLEQSETPQMEIKKDQFDEFIEWISRQKMPSLPQVKSKSLVS